MSMSKTARRLVCAVFIACLAMVPASAQVVISQVYGGGGNSGSTYTNDFIELFNRGPLDVSLTGWSVQYASAAGTSWQVTSLTGTLHPGQHYLVQESLGAGGTQPLPTADAVGAIAMSATAGKVALVNATTALTGACPSSAAIQDFVGFGTTANCSETSPTPAPSNSLAVLRAGNGCTDTGNNSSDFATGAPNPRNSAVAVTPCSLAITTNSPLPDATVSSFYSVTFAAASGSGTGYTFSKISGAFPTGLNLAGATLSGTPTTTSGSPFTFTMQVTDSAANTATKEFTITVKPASTPPTATGAANPASVQAGATTALTVTVTPGSNPTSTGIGVTADLSAIGASSTQQLFDDGLHNDGAANDNVFGFTASIAGGTSVGAKTLPVTVTDAQSRTGSASIALTILPPPPPTTVKISQVYGGGGNSGSTYTHDFIEIFNQGTTPIDLAGWSVQYAGATASTWTVTALCPSGPCMLQPGHYLLIQESQGAGGTTPLPAADVVAGTPALMSASSGKVALMNVATAITGTCPAAGTFVDLVGYGSANCFEGTLPSSTLSNTTASVRRGNGCIDTDNNRNDFVTVGPIPRNSASPAQSCGGDPSQMSGVGIATPGSLLPASNTLLTVKVTPATTPASTNVAVAADLTSIGGASNQQLYDDGTHGDSAAGDGVYSFETTVGAAISTGAKSVLATMTDDQGRSATAPITLTVQSPTCGVERWSVKVGTDPDSSQVDLNNPVRAQIADLGTLTPPVDPPGPPDNARFDQNEKTVFVVNATMTFYKLETDVDYHVVLQDDAGHTMVVEIPSPACILAPGTGVRTMGTSPFADGIAKARQNFDAHFNAQTFFQVANVPVQVKGVGFFDFIHGQTGVAPNGIELHPLLEINFTSPTTTTVSSAPNPSQYGQAVAFTVTVTNSDGSTVPTGNVTLFDSGTPISTATLDANGKAVFNVSSLSVATHSITATYEGDSKSAQSASAVYSHTVDRADQTIAFSALGGKTFGDGDFAVSATASSGLPVSFEIASGPATITGNMVHITGAGDVTVRASQAGTGNYNPAPDVEQSFTVSPAGQTITFAALADKTYGDAAFTVNATGGGSSNPVTFSASGNCTAAGTNGSTITLTGAGSCTVTASQAGDSNYNAAADVARAFSIAKANATIVVSGYSGVYDGLAHGASGSASGVGGEILTSLLNLGAQFTNVPGGTATWSFAGDANYKTASGSVGIVIAKATAAFSDLSSPSIITGTASTTLSGKITLGTLVPTGSITVTLNGVTQNASIQADGSFSSSFATGSLTPVASGYAISYSYAGDTNFNPASGSGTLTVGYNVTPLFDQTRAAQGGSTIPIRLQLTNASGGNASSADIAVTALRLVYVSTNTAGVVQDSGNANADGNFRFDGSAYMFNLSTKGLASGTWSLEFKVAGESATHTVNFQIR